MTVTGAEGVPKNSSFFLRRRDRDRSPVRRDYLVNDKQAEAKTLSGLSQVVSLKERIKYYSHHFLGYRFTQVMHFQQHGIVVALRCNAHLLPAPVLNRVYQKVAGL
jgi:hypothetical protein